MTQEAFKRKLTAILSADVEGYSRLMGEDEDATIRTLTTYRELMTTLIEKHRGRVVDSPGDNLLAEFLSVVDAVRCAVEIQEELRVRNAELPENRRMEFRIGINLGDVVQEKERIYGDGINIAARVEGLADGGGICISGTVYDSIKNKLSLSYESLGEHTVKNITEPVRVYRMRVGPEAAVKPRYWHKAALAAVAVLVVVAGAWAIWNFYFRPPPIEPASMDKMAFPLPDKPSIAVLAFDNMSGDPEQDYLCDGIAEDIITQLSQIYNLFVIARNSSFSYKGKKVKVRQVAEELGVRYVLEGSVQKSGDRVRITAQLVDAITGKHLWAHRYDRELKDFFAIQDEITREVVAELAVKLVEGEGERFGLGTQNLEAWTYIRKALEQFRRFTIEGILQSRELSKKAIDLDPDFSLGHLMLGWTYAITVRMGWSKSPREDLKRAEEIVNKCLALNDSDPGAHNLLGYIYMLRRQYDKAIRQGQRAIALAPSIADSHAFLADSLLLSGRAEEAIGEMTKAMRLAPFYPTWYLWTLGTSYYLAGRFEEAIAAFKESRKRGPHLINHLRMAVIYSTLGREEQARAEAEEVLRKQPTYSLENFRKLLPYKDPAIVERILTFARKAGIPETPPLPLPDKPSIAVLPFVNMSDDPKQEYFSDGITEEIITALSKTPKLFVIARHSTFTYKGKPVKVKQVGREFGVRYVLEGSVRKAGDKMRITAQLIDAATEKHLWAERYDRELKDIFAIQDEITKKIITALQVKLTEGEQVRTASKGTNNLEAYLKCLQANELLHRLNIESIALAKQLTEEAIALDPEYAWAYYNLGRNHTGEVWLGVSKSPKQSITKAMELLQKAIVLDDTFAEPHAALGYLYSMTRQHDKALAEGEMAVALNPNSADSHMKYGKILTFAGRYEESISELKKAIRLNPIPPNIYLYSLGISYCYTGQYEEATTWCEKAVRREPNGMFPRLFMTMVYSLSGRDEEARIEAAEVIRIQPKFSLEKFAKKVTYKNKEDKERCVSALRKAGLK